MLFNGVVSQRRYDPGSGAVMKVLEVMSRDVKSVPPEASLREAAELMRREGVGMLPVIGPRQVTLGVITDRDIAVRAVAEGTPANSKVTEVMTNGVQMVFQDREVEYALQEMARLRVRRVLVCNHALEVVGVLSLADVAANVGDQKIVRVSRVLRRRTRSRSGAGRTRTTEATERCSRTRPHFTNGAGICIDLDTGRVMDRRNQ
jgi:signal-transduction protein with cAMP-binding, CBS, and nucleotidyltransferase domain